MTTAQGTYHADSEACSCPTLFLDRATRERVRFPHDPRERCGAGGCGRSLSAHVWVSIDMGAPPEVVDCSKMATLRRRARA